MEPELILAHVSEKNILSNLIRDYQEEILKVDNVDDYKYLDSYWEKDNRWPYFIKIDGQVAGFVLINCHNIIEKDAKNIVEFYIKKEFRNKGVGKLAAKKAFDLFPGKWEVRELKDNLQAINFWRKVIGEYTKNNFQEIIMNNEKWNGPVQIFNTLSN